MHLTLSGGDLLPQSKKGYNKSLHPISEGFCVWFSVVVPGVLSFIGLYWFIGSEMGELYVLQKNEDLNITPITSHC